MDDKHKSADSDSSSSSDEGEVKKTLEEKSQMPSVVEKTTKW